jgi:hypothetical protein
LGVSGQSGFRDRVLCKHLVPEVKDIIRVSSDESMGKETQNLAAPDNVQFGAAKIT